MPTCDLCHKSSDELVLGDFILSDQGKQFRGQALCPDCTGGFFTQEWVDFLQGKHRKGNGHAPTPGEDCPDDH